MFGLLLSLCLVGLPAFLAGRFFAISGSRNECSKGVALLIFATAVTIAYVALIPYGKLLSANFKLTMPIALFLGVGAGYLWGVRKR